MRRIAACLILSSIALAVAGASALAAARGGTYTGKTAQGRNVRLKAVGNQMRLLSFTIELRCRDGSSLVDTESGFEPSMLRAGRFKERQYGSTDTIQVSGRVQGAKATGTLKVTDKVGKVRCVSPTVKFTAHRR